MSDFDPDAYLRRKESFDPDAYLRRKTPPSSAPAPPKQGMPDWLREAVASGRAQPVGPRQFARNGVDAHDTEARQVFSFETPQGPAEVDEFGNRLMSIEESRQMSENADLHRRLGGFGATGQVGLKDLVAATNAGGYYAAPQLAGVAAAQMHPTHPLDAYRTARDDMRSATDEADRSAGLIPQVAGMVASNPIAPETAGARIGLSALQGMVAASQQSHGDLTRGEVAPVVGDAAAGLGAGAAGGVVGEMASLPIRALQRGAAGQAELAAARHEVRRIGDLTHEGAVLRGSAGGEAAKAGNIVSHIDRVLEHPTWYEPSDLVRATQMNTDPRVVALRSRAFNNAADDAFSQVAIVDQARDMASRALTNIPGRAKALSDAELRPAAVVADVAGRLGRSIGSRVLPVAVGGALGAAGAVGRNIVTNKPLLEGVPSAATGGGAFGAIGSIPGVQQTLRHVVASAPAQAVANSAIAKGAGVVGDVVSRMASAGARATNEDRMVWEAVQADLQHGGPHLGPYARALGSVTGPMQLAMHVALMGQDEQYRRLAESLVP